MSHLHRNVPAVQYAEDHLISSTDQAVQLPKAYTHPILIGGDQLTADQGKGAKKVHADSPTSRLEGLIPVAEDWHTKVTLLEVSNCNSIVNCTQ